MCNIGRLAFKIINYFKLTKCSFPVGGWLLKTPNYSLSFFFFFFSEWSTGSCFFPPSALFFHLQKALPPLLPTSISLRCTSTLSLAGWAFPNIEIPAPVLQSTVFPKLSTFFGRPKKDLLLLSATVFH